MIRLWITVAPGSLRELARGDEGGQHAGADRLAPLVDHEAAVGVAVEGQPEVRAVREHRGLQVAEVLRLDRVGLVVREGAVELEVERHHVEVERPSTSGAVWPAMPLPASTTTFSRRPVHRGQGQQVVGVRREEVDRRDGAGRSARCGGRRSATRSRISVRPVSRPTGAACAWHSLMPLYCAGLWLAVNIAPGQPEVAAGEVELVGRGEADDGDVGTRLGGALGEGPRPCRGSRAACRGRPRPRRPVAARHLDEGVADRAGELLVDLVGDGAAHVVRLEHARQVGRVDGAGVRGLEP